MEVKGIETVAIGAHIELVVSFTCIRRSGAIRIRVEVGQAAKKFWTHVINKK